MTTIVRVKRKRTTSSASCVVLEFAERSECRASVDARARTLRDALDAVLLDGSSGTPYSEEFDRRDDDDEDDVECPRVRRRRAKCARVREELSDAGAREWLDEARAARDVDEKREQDDDAAKGDIERFLGRKLNARDIGAVRVVDVFRDSRGDAYVGAEDIAKALEAEAVLTCNYLPMVREYLNEGGESVENDGNDWVYDVYVYDKHSEEAKKNDEENDDGEFLPVIRVKDFHDESLEEESDYGDSDSNAEDYCADYPDEDDDGDDGDDISYDELEERLRFHYQRHGAGSLFNVETDSDDIDSWDSNFEDEY